MSDQLFDEFLDRDGLWCQVLRPEAARPDRPRPALFLDRDGVLVEDIGYLHRPQDLRLMPGAGDLVGAANRQSCLTVLVSNQSGIGRGFYGWGDFAATQSRLDQELSAAGAALDMVLACPHHAAAAAPYRHPDHPCRKPRPGMVLRAAERLPIDRARSWILGDRTTDLAGRPGRPDWPAGCCCPPVRRNANGRRLRLSPGRASRCAWPGRCRRRTISLCWPARPESCVFTRPSGARHCPR